jgi:hypothetical protein
MVPIMKDIAPAMPANRALAVLDRPAAAADIGVPKRISKKGPRRDRRHGVRGV